MRRRAPWAALLGCFFIVCVCWRTGGDKTANLAVPSHYISERPDFLQQSYVREESIHPQKRISSIDFLTLILSDVKYRILLQPSNSLPAFNHTIHPTNRDIKRIFWQSFTDDIFDAHGDDAQRCFSTIGWQNERTQIFWNWWGRYGITARDFSSIQSVWIQIFDKFKPRKFASWGFCSNERLGLQEGSIGGLTGNSDGSFHVAGLSNTASPSDNPEADVRKNEEGGQPIKRFVIISNSTIGFGFRLLRRFWGGILGGLLFVSAIFWIDYRDRYPKRGRHHKAENDFGNAKPTQRTPLI